MRTFPLAKLSVLSSISLVLVVTAVFSGCQAPRGGGTGDKSSKAVVSKANQSNPRADSSIYANSLAYATSSNVSYLASTPRSRMNGLTSPYEIIGANDLHQAREAQILPNSHLASNY
jgi:hypothetical protein